MKSHRLILTLLAVPCFVMAAGKNPPAKMPDLTQGDAVPANAKHDWNLGATGARGWMYCTQMVTTDARQIAITQVENGSASDGILAVGDVLLGVAGKAFSHDPRTELGKALTLAESDAGGGKLTLTRWRAGKTEEVTLQLAVLGNYSATAPFDCPKSKRILDQGCKALVARMDRAGGEPITRSLNALALLASGDASYLPLIKKEAQWAADFSAKDMQTWRYGYVMMLLAEYVIATGDSSVMPGLKRLALESAQGQSAVGSWGHGFARPDGRLRGYGMMNSPGLPLTIGLVLARSAGVKESAVDLAIERSARLLRFYIGKGAVPYGDHHPWIENHDDNGKCGMAAVLFNLLDEPSGADFFSHMSVASHGSERDTGHTGNFFNMLWAMPGVALSGPQTTGAWMQEFGAWYFDLARQHDGRFPHQGPPENNRDSYAGWDCTGAYLLAYAMPLKKIMLTGKRITASTLDAAAAHAFILDGRGWDNKDRHSFYDALSNDELLQRLASWSPIVRERAALAFARRKDAPVSALLPLLESKNLHAQYGACQALGALRGRVAPAVDLLAKTLESKDLWLRIKAADALATIGAPAMKTVPRMLELLAQVDTQNDPRGMQQRYFTFALFENRDGLLSRSLQGVDREALYKAVRAGLQNQDGRARGSIGSVYRNLTLDEIKPLLPAILAAINERAPSGEMFADTICVEGLKLLSKHHIAEGMAACVKYAREQNPWASQKRTPELMQTLLSYGTHAKAVIPDLTRLAEYFEKDEKDFPKNLMIMKATTVRDTIKAIESSTETPALVHIQ
ncbi:MAG: HEAT repeat domain-containing protein [Verrucomicrobiaceae bacterium]|nr:HEAT repeat domain-containing protein [Verrucomicrobiaceae bacterium]